MFMLSQITFGYVLKFLMGSIVTFSFTLSENFALSRPIRFYDLLTHFHVGEDVLLVYVCLHNISTMQWKCMLERWWVFNYTHGHFFLRKSHRHLLTRELGTSRRQSERLGRGKTYFPRLKWSPDFSVYQSVAQVLYRLVRHVSSLFEKNRPNIFKLAYVVVEFKI